MNLKLMELRKEAGYKSRQSFENATGIKARQFKAVELQEVKITLEDACTFADILGCSLDELVGRNFDSAGFYDSLERHEAKLIDDYRELNDDGKVMASTMVAGLCSQVSAKNNQVPEDQAIA